MRFKAETISSLSDRLPDALIDLWDADSFIDGGPVPGANRQHVFDFDDGLRMIINREIQNKKETFHISASPQDGPMLGNRDPDKCAVHNAIQFVVRRLNDIGLMDIIGEDVNYCVVITERGIIHLLARREDDFDEIRVDGDERPPEDITMTLGSAYGDNYERRHPEGND